MTAEIAILNRNGVALAADSAVSIGGVDQPKIYNTVNKLFSLSAIAPIGAMVFGNALLTGVPWETVVKSFRKDLGTTVFEHLSEYADALIAYVEQTQSLFSVQQEQREFDTSCFVLYSDLRDLINNRLHLDFETSGEVTPDDVARIVAEILASCRDALAENAPLEHLPEGYGTDLVERFRESVNVMNQLVLEDLPFDDESSATLLDLTAMFVERPPSSSIHRAGLVVAGFGETEFTPSLLEFEIHGFMAGCLRLRRKPPQVITPTNEATVAPFAQREMVDLFMSGIDPALKDAVGSALSEFTDALPRIIADATSELTKSAQESLKVGGVGLLAAYRNYLDEHIQRTHVQPILAAVAVLPKEELADMAEALVNLTSFKRRVTLDAETVGGPIDVVIISKGDGLVWIRRKHYFDPALNHHFFANYFRYGRASEEAA